MPLEIKQAIGRHWSKSSFLKTLIVMFLTLTVTNQGISAYNRIHKTALENAPREEFFHYSASIPVEPVYKLGEPPEYVFFRTYKKEGLLVGLNTLKCGGFRSDIFEGNLYITNDYITNNVTTGVFTFGGNLPNHEGTCHLQSIITLCEPHYGVCKTQTVVGKEFSYIK